jgi:hypothetical protein
VTTRSGAGGFDRVGAHPCSDRDPRLVFLVALGIAEVGDDRGDRRRACTFERVNPEEQLDEVVVGGKCGALDEEDIASSYVVEHTHEQVALREPQRFRRSELTTEVLRNRPTQLLTRGPGEQQEVIHLEEATHSCVRGQPTPRRRRITGARVTDDESYLVKAVWQRGVPRSCG